MEAKRDRILAAALEVIAEGGLSAFAQPRIAARAGMRHSHLTYYFPTKSDLLHAVADQVMAVRIQALDAIRDASDGVSKLRVLADVLTDPRQTRLLLALIEGADHDDTVKASFAALRTGIEPATDDLLGSFDRAASPSSRQIIQASSTGLAVLALVNGGPAFRDAAVAMLRSLVEGLPGDARTGADEDRKTITGI